MTNNKDRKEIIKEIIEALQNIDDETLEHVYYTCVPSYELDKFLREASSTSVIIHKHNSGEASQ